MSLITSDDQKKSIFNSSTAERLYELENVSAETLESTIQSLLDHLYSDLKQFYSLSNPIQASDKAEIQKAFLKEFHKLPEKLNGKVTLIVPPLLDSANQEIQGDFVTSLACANMTFSHDLSEMNWREKMKLLKQSLQESKPKLYQLLIQENQKTSSKSDNASRKRGIKASQIHSPLPTLHLTDVKEPDLIALPHQTALELPISKFSPQNSSSHLKFISLEEGIVKLIQSLEKEISSQLGFGSYKKASEVFIRTFETIPASLKTSDDCETDKLRKPKEQNFENDLSRFRQQFAKELQGLNEKDLRKLLLDSLKSSYPQYANEIIKDSQEEIDPLEHWNQLFNEATQSKDIPHKIETVKSWFAAVQINPELNSSQRLWELFFTLAKKIPFKGSIDPLAIEDEFINGTFDTALKFSASDDKKTKDFGLQLASFIMSRSFEINPIQSAKKYADLCNDCPSLICKLLFNSKVFETIKTLQFLSDGKLIALQLIDKYPESLYTNEFKSTFFGLFCQVVMIDPDPDAPVEILPFIPHLKSMLNKTSKCKENDVNLCLKMLTITKVKEYCDLANEMVIPQMDALLKNKKIDIDLCIDLHEFFVKTIADSITQCSYESLTMLKEKALKKWIDAWNGYKIDLSYLYVAILTNISRVADINTDPNDPFRQFHPYIQMALQSPKAGKDAILILLNFILKNTSIIEPDSIVVLTNRLNFLINTVCKDPKTKHATLKAGDLLSNELFWKTLVHISKLAKISNTYSSHYLAVLFSVMTSLTSNEIFKTERSVKDLFGNIIIAFNKAVVKSWDDPKDSEEFLRLTFICDQIVVHFFTQENIIIYVEDLLKKGKTKSSDKSETSLSKEELIKFYDFAIYNLNESVTTDLDHIDFNEDDIGKSHPIFGYIIEAHAMARAIWQTPNTSIESKQMSWSTLFSIYVTLVKKMCKAIPDHTHPVRMEFSKTLNLVVTQLVDIINKVIKQNPPSASSTATSSAQGSEPVKQPQISYRQAIELMLNSHQDMGIPALTYRNKPIELAVQYYHNAKPSEEERKEITEKLFKYCYENYTLYIDDEVKLLQLFLLFRYTLNDRLDSGSPQKTNIDTLLKTAQKAEGQPKSASQPVRNDMHYVIKFLEYVVDRAESPDACLLATYMISYYLKYTDKGMVAFDAVVCLFLTIFKKTIQKDPDPAYHYTYLKIFKLIQERMSDQTSAIPVINIDFATDEELNNVPSKMNYAITAFTKSSNEKDHQNFKYLLSALIKGAMCFHQNLSRSEQKEATIAIRKELFGNLLRFAITCKTFGLAENPESNDQTGWSIFLKDTILKLALDPEKNQDQIEGAKAIINMINAKPPLVLPSKVSDQEVDKINPPFTD